MREKIQRTGLRGGMDARNIIVIHPGSQNLRIGRASDLNPITIVHAVGYRLRKTYKCAPHHDNLLPAIAKVHPKQLQSDFEEQRLQVTHTLQTYVPQNERKRLRVATPPQQIASFNRNSIPDDIPSCAKTMLTELDDVIYDKQIVNLTATEAAMYNIHFPIRRGDLNVHSGNGGSLRAVLSQLEAIWLYALNKHFGINEKKLQGYSAVLVINDTYNRSILREFVNLLLQRLRFRSCFLVQDHVASTYGAGLGYACVVDVGDQKCSISCVEDSISHPYTRVRLGYGGGDVTQVFLFLLRKCGFPYKECNAEINFVDAKLLQDLKEKFCHLKPEICGAHEQTFEVQPKIRRLRYTLQLGDECLVAPLALFHTDLMNITGRTKSVCTQVHSNRFTDPEDCFDAEYLRETGRRNGGRDQLLEGTIMPVTGDAGDDELVVVDGDDTREERENSILHQRDKEEQSYYHTIMGQILSLEQAIIRSIERCHTEELKRKMYGCILLVGGGIKFAGLSSWLERKMTLQLAAARTVITAPKEVNVYTKEMDTAMVAWKGAAIMSCLESALELWITANEWDKFGLRILREKAPFIW